MTNKEELYDKVVEARRVNDRVMSHAIVLEGEVGRVVCAYASQSGKWMEDKQTLYEDKSRKCTTHHMSEPIIGMGDSSGHDGRNIDGFYEAHVGLSNGERNHERWMLLELCHAMYSCIANTWLGKADKKKITYGSGRSESENDLNHGKGRSQV